MVEMENNRVKMIKLRLQHEFNIKVLDEWLSGCVLFSLQENPKISNENLFQFAYSQWLLADLTNIGIPVLPPDFDKKVEQHTLSGSFPLQMQYMIDISEPAYEQWRNLYDKKLDEADDEVQMRRNQAPNVKKRRMLKLMLTDGKQTVVALEHSPISCLYTQLLPGLKLQLTGPLRCVNNVIFLESKNVRVLGGEVDVLLITNAYENVLLRVLNRPANPNPKLDYEEVEVSEIKNRPNYKAIESIPMNTHSVAKEYQRKSQVVDEEDVDDSLLLGIDLDMVEGSQPDVRLGSSKPEQVAAISTLMDDDDEHDIVQLVDAANVSEIMNHQVTSTRHSQSSPVSAKSISIQTRPKPSFYEPMEDDIDMLNTLEDEIRSELHDAFPKNPPDGKSSTLESPKVKKIRMMDEYISPPLKDTKTSSTTSALPSFRSGCTSTVSKESMVPQPSTSKTFNNFNVSTLFDDSMDCIQKIVTNNALSKPNILCSDYAFCIDGVNLATIEQILALSDQSRAGSTFLVYCEVSGVNDQPRIRKQQWHLSLQLTDHSDVLNSVRLHDNVVAKMVKHEAADLMQMRKIDKEGVLRLLDSILHDFTELLQEIKCFWRIVYPAEPGDSENLPIVMATYEMNEERGAILLDKIIKENCSQLRKML
ncbi:uncharacterized protein LOC128720728 [Anopheles nili]|uniref:uncharacterized protein LOC128720728 n=1 Tax=Anopheles nili TaxID=185578 RepID=UPI00237B4D32|nr:uncharacterized protein LOC128720728 [Anopheles nili]